MTAPIPPAGETEMQSISGLGRSPSGCPEGKALGARCAGAGVQRAEPSGAVCGGHHASAVLLPVGQGLISPEWVVPPVVRIQQRRPYNTRAQRRRKKPQRYHMHNLHLLRRECDKRKRPQYRHIYDDPPIREQNHLFFVTRKMKNTANMQLVPKYFFLSDFDILNFIVVVRVKLH